MRHVRLILFMLLSGAVAAVVGGFLTVFTIALIELGLAGLLVGLPAAGMGILVSLRLATLPAMLLGGILWYSGVRSKRVWAGVGALAGLGLYAFFSAFPSLDNSAALITGPGTLTFAPVFVLAGAPSALAFRLMMEALTIFDEDPGRDT